MPVLSYYFFSTCIIHLSSYSTFASLFPNRIGLLVIGIRFVWLSEVCELIKSTKNQRKETHVLCFSYFIIRCAKRPSRINYLICIATFYRTISLQIEVVRDSDTYWYLWSQSYENVFPGVGTYGRFFTICRFCNYEMYTADWLRQEV